MLKIRLHGKNEEIEKIVQWLELQNEKVEMLSESELYKGRGKSVYARKYLDIEMKN